MGRNVPASMEESATCLYLMKQRNDAIDALRYLMERFEAETWQCERCCHAEDTATMDSANWLREWFKTHNVQAQPGRPGDERSKPR